MAYAFLSPNGEPELEGLWDWLKTRDWEKTFKTIGAGRELLPGGSPTIPISSTIVTTPGYDPYAPKPFDIGSLLIPGAIIVGGGLLVLILVKAMKK